MKPLKNLFLASLLILAACDMAQEEPCEANNTSMVTFLNDTGDDVIIEATYANGICSGTGPLFPPGAKFTRTGTPGESFAFCATFFSAERTDRVEGVFPSECKNREEVWK